MINFKRIKTHRYEFSLYDIFTIFTIRKTKEIVEIDGYVSIKNVQFTRLVLQNVRLFLSFINYSRFDLNFFDVPNNELLQCIR